MYLTLINKTDATGTIVDQNTTLTIGPCSLHWQRGGILAVFDDDAKSEIGFELPAVDSCIQLGSVSWAQFFTSDYAPTDEEPDNTTLSVKAVGALFNLSPA